MILVLISVLGGNRMRALFGASSAHKVISTKFIGWTRFLLLDKLKLF